MNVKGLESTNVTNTCHNEAKKREENLITYDNKGEGNASNTSEKKERARHGYVCMYECTKQLCHSTYEH